jgi:hemerythrin
MAFFEWGKQYEVGIMQIDSQHKYLVKLVNQMYEAMAQRQGQEVLGKVLSELTAYTATHFKNEEQLMQQHGYPEFSTHKAKHDAMVKKVMDLKSQYDAGKAAVLSNSVSSFLKDWLIKHIQGTDMKYAPFLKEKGVS